MKVLKTYLGGDVVLGWQNGDLMLSFNGSAGGGKLAGIFSGAASFKVPVVEEVENLGEAEMNAFIQKHEPTFLPFIQTLEAWGNAKLASLG